MNIISDIWYGKLDPCCSFGTGNAELRRLEAAYGKSYRKLEALLDEAGRELLNEYRSGMNSYVAESIEQAFYDGFCLGTRITAEAMTGVDSVV